MYRSPAECTLSLADKILMGFMRAGKIREGELIKDEEEQGEILELCFGMLENPRYYLAGKGLFENSYFEVKLEENTWQKCRYEERWDQANETLLGIYLELECECYMLFPATSLFLRNARFRWSTNSNRAGRRLGVC